jgi:arylsulfatase
MSDHASADGEMLPIPDRPYDGPVFEDAKDPAAAFPPIEPLRPPDGAPNVLIILLDDVGFGASSAFGGEAASPAPSAGSRSTSPMPPKTSITSSRRMSASRSP